MCNKKITRDTIGWHLTLILCIQYTCLGSELALLLSFMISVSSERSPPMRVDEQTCMQLFLSWEEV